MHFYSLRELASEEPSESGRNVGTLHLRKPIPLQRRCLAPLLQRDRRRQQHLAGESWSAEGAPDGIGGGGSQAGSEESDSGQHDGSVISCVGTDRDLRLYVRSVAS